MDIIININFTKKFDKEKYTNIILYMDKLMKIYMYILSDRYSIYIYMPIFIELRNKIIEIFYSLYVIIPQKLTHTYGFETYDEIKKSLNNFKIYSKEMITIIEKYGKINKNILYIEDTKYKPYNVIKNNINLLP